MGPKGSKDLVFLGSKLLTSSMRNNFASHSHKNCSLEVVESIIGVKEVMDNGVTKGQIFNVNQSLAKD